MPGTKSNTSFAVNLLLLASGMLALAYASVPLYRIFCDITGYGGTTREGIQAPGEVANHAPITITFNADINPDLNWSFTPGEKSITLPIGKQGVTYYMAENLSDQPLTGRATYNVTPFSAGAYFSKIACFCFEEQTLAPHEKTKMPIVFYIDPEILNDPDTKDLSTITLSYTFFPVKTETSDTPHEF